jgi:hypothetical protein
MWKAQSTILNPPVKTAEQNIKALSSIHKQAESVSFKTSRKEICLLTRSFFFNFRLLDMYKHRD